MSSFAQFLANFRVHLMACSRPGLSFHVLGVFLLAMAVFCLAWANSLGDLNVLVVATTAILLAMISHAKASRMQRAASSEAFNADPAARPSILNEGPRSRLEEEDAEIALRLAALRRASRSKPTIALAADVRPPVRRPDPVAAQRAHAREQIEEVRAELTRLREGAKARQAAVAGRVSVAPADFMEQLKAPAVPPNNPTPSTAHHASTRMEARKPSTTAAPETAFPKAGFTGLLDVRAPAAPLSRSLEEWFPNTEISGLNDGSAAPSSSATGGRSGFERTDFLGIT